MLVIVLAIVGGGGFALYRFLTDSGDSLGEIYAVPAEIGSIQSTVSGSGSAKAKEAASITLTAGGTVREVFVTSGDIVYAGQPLYSIDSQAAQQAVDAAQQALNALNEDMNDLYGQRNDLTVRAPFAGRLTEVGEFHRDDQVGAGMTVATLVNDTKLKLSLYFSYAYEDSIYVGQPATVTIPAVMGFQDGIVDKINKVNYITPEGASFFEVVISFDNPGTLTAGMTASAIMTAADGTEIFPYRDGSTAFYETRTITTKAGGPVVQVGNLLNYASVASGEVLLTLGSDTVDAAIRAKQEQVNAAQQKLEEAQKAMENFNAVAPIDGTVITCTLTEGAEVKSGDTVIIISNTTTMLVNITVDDKNISFIHPGDFVNLDWNGNMYQGAVTAIDMGGAQQGSGITSYPVTLTVDNYDGSLMDGAWLKYSFVTSESNDCVVVPASAVRTFSDMEGNRRYVVFVQREIRPDDVPELDLPTFDPNMGQQRNYPTEEEGYYPVIVETGIGDTKNCEILSGVEPGDMIFVNYTVTSGSWG